MATDEARLDDGEGKQLSRAARVQHLVNRVTAHEADAAEIDAEMSALGLSKAQVKKIQATQKTLAALMGGEILPAGTSL